MCVVRLKKISILLLNCDPNFFSLIRKAFIPQRFQVLDPFIFGKLVVYWWSFCDRKGLWKKNGLTSHLFRCYMWKYSSSIWYIFASTSYQQPLSPGQAQEESQVGCGHRRSLPPRGFSGGRQLSGSLWHSDMISAAPHWLLSIPRLSGKIIHH